MIDNVPVQTNREKDRKKLAAYHFVEISFYGINIVVHLLVIEMNCRLTKENR